MKKNPVFIIESAEPSEVKIIEESIIPGGGNKIVFKAILQEANHINNNKRFYPTDTLMEVVRQLQPKARNRELMGEMDHPQPQGDSAAKLKRSSTILMQNVCVLFTDLVFEDNKIIATCETLSNRAGQDLYALIKDNVVIGFSLRAFGETDPRPDGSVGVKAQGLKALTFDCVLNPSHSNATIIEFLSESEDPTALMKELQEYSTSLNGIKNDSLIEEASELFNSIEESSIKQSSGCKLGVKCINGVCLREPLEESIDYLANLSFNYKPAKVQLSF